MTNTKLMQCMDLEQRRRGGGVIVHAVCVYRSRDVGQRPETLHCTVVCLNWAVVLCVPRRP